MTIDEFNIKYKEWLPDGYYGLDINNKEVIAWLDNLFEHYLTKIDGFEYHQIKLKFGGSVRFYSNLNHNSITQRTLISIIQSNITSILRLEQVETNLNNTIKVLEDRLDNFVE